MISLGQIGILGAAALCAALLASSSVGAAESSTVDVTLNKTLLSIDKNTGSIVKMSYPGVGTMIDATGGLASLVDMAYPIDKFEPFRLASRFSSNPVITPTDKDVSIHWESLGGSRDFEFEGRVSATVKLAAAPDGKSIVMTCEVDNQSPKPVRQVLFPDFAGVVPFAGTDGTLFRSAGVASRPFQELAPNEDRASIQYCHDVAGLAIEYASGGMFHPMVLRWFDIGSHAGGFSLFPKRWGWDTQNKTRLQYLEKEQKLRVMTVHSEDVAPIAKWQSGEYWLTPHTGGWAVGVEPYRQWVKQNYKRKFAVPEHVRKGLGFRTLWMCEGRPEDPKDVIFKLSDLPALARESKEHGLTEMVPWAWQRWFRVPVPPPWPHLGTEADLVDAARKCKEQGVNLSLFVSLIQSDRETAPRYGWSVGPSSWTYHTELIPNFNPPYCDDFASCSADVTNTKWQQDVLDGLNHYIDIGTPSICWDQLWMISKDANMYDLTEKIRTRAKKKDPQSTFSAEELWNMELDSQYLDYTWNWGGYRDCRIFTSLFPAPRVNCCITSYPRYVKLAFADNMYLNIFPRQFGRPNGSDWIKNYPEFSQTLKTCAKLREQFLPYFTDGTLIGDCIFPKEPIPQNHLSAYVLENKIMAVLVNDAPARDIELDMDVASYIKSKSGKFTVKAYDGGGKLKETREVAGPAFKLSTGHVESLDITIWEIIGN